MSRVLLFEYAPGCVNPPTRGRPSPNRGDGFWLTGGVWPLVEHPAHMVEDGPAGYDGAWLTGTGGILVPEALVKAGRPTPPAAPDPAAPDPANLTNLAAAMLAVSGIVSGLVAALRCKVRSKKR